MNTKATKDIKKSEKRKIIKNTGLLFVYMLRIHAKVKELIYNGREELYMALHYQANMKKVIMIYKEGKY